MKKKRGDQKLIIKIMLLVVVIVLGVLYKVSSSTIIEDQLEGVENQVATTLYKENQGAGGNGGSGGTGSVIPGGGDSGESGSENGGSQSVDKTTVQELPNYATKLDPDGAVASLTTKTVVGQDLDSLKNALVSNNVLSESEAANVDGIVVITGDVSNVGALEIDTSKYCNSGETVVVVTYDEAKKTYSYVGKATVGSDKKVTVDVNGGSSKTEFATKDENGSIVAGVSKAAGLYDANGVMLCSWEDSGIDVEKDYTDSTCKIDKTSPYYIITNIYKYTKKIVLPDRISKIGNYAFFQCGQIEDVTFSNSIKTIGIYAFYGCSGLANVIIPEGVTSIGNHAFDYCHSISNMTIPSSVNSMGACAFYGCSGEIIINCNIPDSSSSVYPIFYKSCITKVTINEGVRKIGDYAFEYCENLTEVIIPEGVTSIGTGAFYNCSKLTNVTIPSSVVSIGTSAFSLCSNLTNVTIMEGVTNIKESAFGNCYHLTSIIIPSSVTRIGANAFYKTGLTSVTFENVNGWYIGNKEGVKTTAVSSSILSDSSTAATYIKSYYDKYWTR